MKKKKLSNDNNNKWNQIFLNIFSRSSVIFRCEIKSNVKSYNYEQRDKHSISAYPTVPQPKRHLLPSNLSMMQYCCHRSSINGSKLNHFLARAFGLMPKPILKPRPQVESYLFGRIKGGGRLADDFRVLGMPPGHMLLIGHLAGKGAGNYRHLEVGASFLYPHTRHANDGDSVCSTFHKVYSFLEWKILVFFSFPLPLSFYYQIYGSWNIAFYC